MNMTLDEFKKEILIKIGDYPQEWRFGQKVFNYIDMKYHVARKLQYEKGVDCFYNDAYTEDFIDAAYNELKNNDLK